MASSSAMVSRSFGSPAARLTVINRSSERQKHFTPNTSMTSVSATRSSYVPPPVISPSRSMSPAPVVNVKLSPRKIVPDSHENGSPGGATSEVRFKRPKRGHEAFHVLAGSCVYDVDVIRGACGAMGGCGYSADGHEIRATGPEDP